MRFRTLVALVIGASYLVPCQIRAELDPTKKITQYVHDVWTTDAGLPQNSVLALAQTPDGYLWIGTEEGLSRFDGVRFVTFDKSSIPGLQSNEVDALLVDGQGVLWIGTRGGGLISLRHGAFQIYTRQSGLSSDAVQALYEDGRGDLWIGTDGGGLDRLHDGRFTHWKRSDGLSDDAVFALCGDGKGGVWIGTHRGLSHWGGGRLVPVAGKHALPDTDIRSLYMDRDDGTFWVGTNGAGLIRLGPDGARRLTTQNGLSSNRIWSIQGDSSGSLWLGTGGGGIVRYFRGAFSVFDAKSGFSGDDVWAIKEDREGSLWIGSAGGGLNRLRDGSFVTTGAREGLSSDTILAVYQDREGALWVGTADAGANRLEHGAISYFGTGNGLPDSQVFSIAEDGHGSHWFGTRRGLARLRGGTVSLFTLKNGLPADTVTCTYVDSRGDLWVGTRNGVGRFDGWRFVTYGAKDGLAPAGVLAIYEDTVDHSMWFGTGAGLSHFAGGKFRNYTRLDGLSNDVVRAISGDPDGTLWMATDGGGLNRFRGGHFTSFTVKDGIFDDGLFAVLDDLRGDLWLSSNRGVFRVAKSELEAFAGGTLQHITSVPYVAMTRAQQTLVLTGHIPKKATLDEWRSAWSHHKDALPEDVLLGGSSPLDWIMPAVASLGASGIRVSWPGKDAPPDAAVAVTIHGKEGAEDKPAPAAPSEIAARLLAGEPLPDVPADARVEELFARLRRVYPHAAAAARAAVQTVTALKSLEPQILEDEAVEIAPGMGDVDAGDVVPTARDDAPGEGDTQARSEAARLRGIATHRILELVDLADVTPAALDRQRAAWLQRRAISTEDLDRANWPGIRWFLNESESGRRLRAAASSPETIVRREIPFAWLAAADLAPAASSWLVPPLVDDGNPALPDPADLPTIRGIIDVLIASPTARAAEIMDYKTDAAFLVDQRLDAYRRQMRYYLRAASDILGFAVPQATLIFLAARREIIVRA